MSFFSITDFAGAGLGAPPHGHHHRHHGGGGGHWGPTYGPGYYDPYWNASPSPYLVILDGDDEDDEDAKKKKRKKKLAERLGTAWNW